MVVIRDVNEPSAMVLWMAMLWLKCTELIPVVKEQLEAATGELVRESRKTDLDMYLSVVDVELKKAEEKLKEYKYVVHGSCRHRSTASSSLKRCCPLSGAALVHKYCRRSQ